jgi:hypothetical protein
MSISNSELKVPFTLFDGDGPNTKIMSLNPDGTLNKKTTMNFTGTARKVAGTLSEIATVLDKLPSNFAIMSAVSRHDAVKVGAADYLKDGEIARSKDEFSFEDGPGLLYFDYDADNVGQHYSPDELIELIDTTAARGIAKAERIQRLSTSAGVRTADGRLVSNKNPGCHIAMVVEDATDIPRIGKLIHDKLTLAGHGYCILSRSGSILHRSPSDASIYQETRMMYEAAPVLKDGLVQDKRSTELVDGIPCWDTKEIPDLSPAEQVQLTEIREANAEVVRPFQEAVRRAYAAERALETGNTAEEEYQALVAADSGVFKAHYVIQTKAGATLTVQEQIDLMKPGQSVPIKNPVEPDISNATLIKHSNGQGATIVIYNHGGSKLRVQNLQTTTISLIPAFPVPTGTLLAARIKVELFVAKFGDATKDHWATDEAERSEIMMLLITPTGTGKSTAVRNAIVKFVADNPGRTIVYAVPNHTLGREQELEMRTLMADKGISVGVYRGRGADDYNKPTGDPDPKLAYEKICPDHKDAAKVAAAGGDVFSSLCLGSGRRCPFFDKCPYLLQQDLRADVWIVPHHLLLNAKPKCIGKVAAVIVDEDITQLMFHGLDSRSPYHISFGDMETASRALRQAGEETEKQTKKDIAEATFSRAERMLQSMVPLLDALAKGTVNKRELLRAIDKAAPLGNEGPDAAGALKNLNSMLYKARREVKGVMPGQSASTRTVVLEQFSEHNATLGRVGAMATDIRDFLTAAPADWFKGPDTLDDLKRIERNLLKATLTGHDRPALDDMAKRYGIGDKSILPGVRRLDDGLSISWIKQFRVGWQVPTLFMDATAKPEVYKAIFPAIGDNVEQVECSAPYMTVRQVTDWRGSRNQIIPDKKRDKKENIAHVAHIIEARAAEYKGKGKVVDGKQIDVLVITYLAAEEILEGIGMPPGVEIAHFGKLVGIDRYKHVACVIIIGGAVKGVDVIERRAELLKGDALDVLDHAFIGPQGGWYAVEQVEGSRRDKQPGPALERNYHNDPLAEALREQMIEGELMQALGRGRGVLRTKDDPVHVDILTNVPLPGVAVDEFYTWDEIKPDWTQRMAARGVVMECRIGRHGFWPVAGAVLDLSGKQLKDHVFDTEKRDGGDNEGAGSSLSGLYIRGNIYNPDSEGGPTPLIPAPTWGRASVRLGRFSVPIFFAPDVDLRDTFGTDTYIQITEAALPFELTSQVKRLSQPYLFAPTYLSSNREPIVRRASQILLGAA